MSGVTRYDVMPIPHIDEQTTYVDAGALTFGIEYRLLDEAIAAAATLEKATGDIAGNQNVSDRGVSIHVFGPGEAGDGLKEYLRFDCFEEDPHYHYISWAERFNDMVHLDPVSEGDALAWTLDRIRQRLPQMLARAGAQELAKQIDPAHVDAALPRVAEVAYRARYDVDEDAVRRSAMSGGRG